MKLKSLKKLKGLRAAKRTGGPYGGLSPQQAREATYASQTSRFLENRPKGGPWHAQTRPAGPGEPRTLNQLRGVGVTGPHGLPRGPVGKAAPRSAFLSRTFGNSGIKAAKGKVTSLERAMERAKKQGTMGDAQEGRMLAELSQRRKALKRTRGKVYAARAGAGAGVTGVGGAGVYGATRR